MNEIRPDPDTDLLRQLAREGRHGFWTKGKTFAAVLALVAIVAGAGWLFYGGTPAVPYVTEDVTRGPLTVTVSATGTLQPESEVNVGAEVSGRVDAVNVDFNDHVTKGQVLAIINTDQIQAQMAQDQAALNAAQAGVVTSEATVNETKAKRDRAQGLYMRSIVSQQEQQTAEADYARAVAAVAKAKADVANAAALLASHRTTLGKAAIRSPIDGIVLDRIVQPGQTVAASFQTPVMFVIASDLSRMQLQADIDEADIGQVHAGLSATFSVDAYPQRRFAAQLIALRNAPTTVNGVVTYQAVLAVDNSAGLLRPGLTATAEILTGQNANALLVPNGALRFAPSAAVAKTAPAVAQGKARVWVLENGKPIAHDIETGRSDGRLTEVTAGDLKEGMRVITDTASAASRPAPGA